MGDKMQIHEVKAKSILRKHKRIDSWFISKYGINLYRGCSHDCSYCDGRAEGYYVEGDFSKDITVKINAEELLNRELDRSRKRKLMSNCFITLGGGVSDAYQHIEKKYELSRKTLLLIEKYNWPVHILTKSDLVLRDLDIIKRINEKSKAIVSFSFSSVDDEISKTFEPGSSLPSKRLEAMKKIKEAGITTGIFYMPVIPLITDSKKQMEETLKKCKNAGAEFVIFGSMTLKPGRQKEYFMDVLSKNYPMYVERYENHYLDNNKYGAPSHEYRVYIHK